MIKRFKHQILNGSSKRDETKSTLVTEALRIQSRSRGGRTIGLSQNATRSKRLHSKGQKYAVELFRSSCYTSYYVDAVIFPKDAERYHSWNGADVDGIGCLLCDDDECIDEAQGR